MKDGAKCKLCGATITKLVFNTIMDESKLHKFLEVQLLDPQVRLSMIKAGEDFAEFIETDGKIGPSGWSVYLRNAEDE